MLFRRFFFSFILLFALAEVQASDLYFSIRVSETDIKINELDNFKAGPGRWGQTQLESETQFVDVISDDSSSGGRLALGRRLSDLLSVEVFYTDFGEVDLVNDGLAQIADVTQPTIWSLANVSGTSEASAYGLAMQLNSALSASIDAYLKAGIASWDIDSEIKIEEQPPSAFIVDPITAKSEVSGTDVFLGLGVAYKLTDSVSLMLDFEDYDFDGANIQVLSFGASLAFGS